MPQPVVLANREPRARCHLPRGGEVRALGPEYDSVDESDKLCPPQPVDRLPDGRPWAAAAEDLVPIAAPPHTLRKSRTIRHRAGKVNRPSMSASVADDVSRCWAGAAKPNRPQRRRSSALSDTASNASGPGTAPARPSLRIVLAKRSQTLLEDRRQYPQQARARASARRPIARSSPSMASTIVTGVCSRGESLMIFARIVSR